MLKIKSNTNEFTIIFLRRLERKRMLKRSRLASIQFSTPSSFLLFFFSGQRPFLLQPSFSFQFQRSPFCFSVPHFSLFQLSFSFSFSASFLCFSLLVSAFFFSCSLHPAPPFSSFCFSALFLCL